MRPTNEVVTQKFYRLHGRVVADRLDSTHEKTERRAIQFRWLGVRQIKVNKDITYFLVHSISSSRRTALLLFHNRFLWHIRFEATQSSNSSSITAQNISRSPPVKSMFWIHRHWKYVRAPFRQRCQYASVAKSRAKEASRTFTRFESQRFGLKLAAIQTSSALEATLTSSLDGDVKVEKLEFFFELESIKLVWHSYELF